MNQAPGRGEDSPRWKGERGLERRGQWSFIGLSLPKDPERKPHPVLSGEDTPKQSAPERGGIQGNTGLPNRCGTDLHSGHKPHHLSCGPAGEVGKPGGCWRQVWGSPSPVLRPLPGQQVEGPSPLLPWKASRVSAPATPSQRSELGTSDVYFVLCTVQKELGSPAPSPDLICRPPSSQLAS